MQATTTLNLHPALTSCVAVPPAHVVAEDNVLAALIEALSSGEHYEIIDRGGELFVQPVAAARPVRGTPAFSPDARARYEAYGESYGMAA
jgi:hypothetical protein